MAAALRHRDSGMLSHRSSSSQLRPSGASASTNTNANVNGANGSAATSSSTNDGTSVQVVVRIRPLTTHDQTAIPARWQRLVVNGLSTNAVQVDASGQTPPGGSAPPPGAAKRPTFTFDRVLTPTDGQEQVYNTSVLPLIQRYMEGYNVTILAYGQTSSGKSHTMGTSISADDDFEGLVAGQRAHPNIGIIPRAVAQIFEEIKQNQARNPNTQYTAKASFIEIYNEELIDLLADGVDNRPLVQIREDKAGHIIWSGLREVRVHNVPDVMNHLLQGSSVRRTNETDMNAQSSRSHAIFSLTLTQRKFTGSSSPSSATSLSPQIGSSRPPSAFGAAQRNSMLPRSTTPTGRSSALPRPSSRIMSPGRASTPTQSSMGRAAADAKAGSNDAAGEWVTVTSKFHFVDLAGSERLKRTAAQGDRVKEGISINSGLHALGNVISALGDPAKSRRTTHIPYRDSKLTRLLQDSLGGNAHTLMIACVSPTEYNVNETVNTLQYANRARNIKNKAELNEVEVGWDDVEYLQTQVLKLRKELQILKGFRSGTAGSEAALRAMDQKDVLEWQSKYTVLSQKYSQMTAEMTKLQQQASKESMSNEDYLKAAEPIIIEYEKTVDLLEGQINLMKAALGHSEDVILAHEQAANERELKIVSMEQDLEVREQTVTDLQTRLTKLEDREASADRYARELEARLTSHVSNGDADAQTVANLKRDLGRQREADGRREEYIKELESRLARAEESTSTLQTSVTKAEQEVERREEAYGELQQRMNMLDSTNDSKTLLEELEQRDVKLLDLETKLSALQTERDDVVRERGRLTDAAAAHHLERGKLEDQVRELKSAATAAAATAAASAAMSSKGALQTSAPMSRQTSASYTSGAGTANEEEMAFLQTQVEMLSEELKSNQEATAKVQADLISLEAKYTQSLREIDDLNRQVTEAKLVAPASPAAERDEQQQRPSLSRRSSLQMQSGGRSKNGARPESLLLDGSPARRKALSRRSSSSFLGYNPRESTPRDGSQTPRSAVPTIRTPGTDADESSNGNGSLFRTRSLSQSLGQELQSGGRRHLSLSGSADFAKIGWTGHPPLPGTVSPGGSEVASLSPADLERKVRSLEAETMRLQETLKERDDEIAVLERAAKAKEMQQTESKGESGQIQQFETKLNGVAVPAIDQNSLSFPVSRVDMDVPAGDNLNRTEGGVDEEGSAQLSEIMRSLARKEQEAMRQVEQLKQQLEEQRREKDGLTSMQENQTQIWAAEMEGMRKHEADLKAELEALRANVASQSSVREVNGGSKVPKGVLAENVALANVSDMPAQDDAPVDEPKQDEGLVEKVKEDDGSQETLARSVDMAKTNDEYDDAIGDAASQQFHTPKEPTLPDDTAVEKSTRLENAIRAKEEESDRVVAKLREEHQAALLSKDDVHSRAMDTLSSEHAIAIAKLGDDHASALQSLRQEHESALAEAQKSLAEVQEKQTLLLDTHANEQQTSKRDLDTLQQNHVHVLEQIETLKTEHSERLRDLTQEHSRRVAKIEESLKDAHSEREALDATHAELQERYQALVEQDPNDVVALRAELAETSDSLVTIEEALTRVQEERDVLQRQLGEIQSGDAQAAQAKQVAQAQKEVEHLQASLANVRSELQRSKSDIQGMLEEKTRQESLMRELQIKLTIAETRSASSARSREGGMSASNSDSNHSLDSGFNTTPRSPASKRESSEHEGFGSQRGSRLGVSSNKPPPLTPPPNNPLPPTPNGATTPTQRSSMIRSSASSTSLAAAQTNGMRAESPSMLSRSSSIASMHSPINIASDPAKASKLVSEQAEEIEKLTKQLNHCEQDLQANIDLVATLEAALNDSERNLRKSRVQLSEATRERERYAVQCDDLRQQVEQAQKEMERERNSGQLERQGWESRIQQEREAKERARRALEARLDDVQKKKNSKLFCM